MSAMTRGWLCGIRMAPASAYCRGSANGWAARSWPPVLKVLILPPARLPLASRRVTVCPARRSSMVATSPAGPAPTTRTFFGAVADRGRPPPTSTCRYDGTRSRPSGPRSRSARATSRQRGESTFPAAEPAGRLPSRRGSGCGAGRCRGEADRARRRGGGKAAPGKRVGAGRRPAGVRRLHSLTMQSHPSLTAPATLTRVLAFSPNGPRPSAPAPAPARAGWTRRAGRTGSGSDGRHPARPPAAERRNAGGSTPDTPRTPGRSPA